MPHVLCKLTDVDLELVVQQLKRDSATHAEQRMYLERVWIIANRPQDVLFLFRVDDLASCQERMQSVHAAARQQNPAVKLPEVVFLRDA